MKVERLIFAGTLAVVSVISLFIGEKEMGLIALGAIAAIFTPHKNTEK